MKLFHNLFFSIVLFSSAIFTSTAISAENVNINTANAEEIAGSMHGIGENKARAIVEYRSTHGKFKSLQELENVAGIGAKTVEKNKDNLSL